MGLKPIAKNSFLVLALALVIVAVLKTGPSPKSHCEAESTNEDILLQLAGQLEPDEASFLQVSDTVTRHSLGNVQAAPAHANKNVLVTHGAASERHQAHGVQATFSYLLQVGKGALEKTEHMMHRRSAIEFTSVQFMVLLFLCCGCGVLILLCQALGDLDDNFYAGSAKSYRPGQSYMKRAGSPQSSPGQHHLQVGSRGTSSPIPANPDNRLSGSAPSGSRNRLNSDNSIPSSSAAKMGGELRGAVVPANRKFAVKIPHLLAVFPPDTEILRRYVVHTKDDVEMIFLKVFRHKRDASSNFDVHIEEYMTLSMPPEPERELLICTFGRSDGAKVSCEIYKNDATGGTTLYALLQEEASEASGAQAAHTFVLWLASEPMEKLLVIEIRGRLQDRRVKVLDGRSSSAPLKEVASTVPTAASDKHYEAECYPGSDVMLVSLALASVDRIVANSSGSY